MTKEDLDKKLSALKNQVEKGLINREEYKKQTIAFKKQYESPEFPEDRNTKNQEG